jgi:Protein of unknown function (DUF1579)
MMRPLASALAVAAWLVLVPAVGVAQPGPEHKKLDAFVGRWRIDLDVKATATTTVGKASGTEDCEWFANLHVVCRTEATGAGGLYRSMRTLSYVPMTKSYASYTIDSLGYAVLTFGRAVGGTWTFSSEGTGFNVRSVVKQTKDGYTATSEYAGADGKWTTASVVTATRAK